MITEGRLQRLTLTALSIGKTSLRGSLEIIVMGERFVPLVETIAVEGSDVIWMAW